MIPIINKKGLNKVESFGVIEVPVPPITFINADSIEVEKWVMLYLEVNR